MAVIQRALVGGIVAIAALSPARAAIDDSKPLLCAGIELMSCAPGEGCRTETADSLNAPRFLAIDVAARTVTGQRPQVGEMRTPIANVRTSGGDIILDGVEAKLSWSIAIDKDSGDMTLTGIRTQADESMVIVVFGACTNR